MKPEETRSPVPAKHELEHELPTVIHHPEEEMPLLRRWVEDSLANPVKFWGTIAIVSLVLFGLSVLGSGWTPGGHASDEAWTKLELAKTAAERVDIAKEFPKTPAERWALLQAASEFYDKGLSDLPANREVALPSLKKALDLYEKVSTESPQDSPQARIAAFGMARTYEARNELDKAISQYEKVGKSQSWAGTEEARDAERLAKTLKSPEAVNFYKDLYAFKPVEATIPPGGIGNLNLPGLPALGGSTPNASSPFSLPITSPLSTGSKGATEPSPFTLPPPPPTSASSKDSAPPVIKVEEAPAAKKPDMKPEPAKTAAPKDETKPAAPKADGGLPADVFAPGSAPK